MDIVTIYTDGACIGNPGPGGYGAVLLYERAGQVHRKEISGGYQQTTNNRMEIMAVIKALEALSRPCKVRVFSDSEYVVKTISLGWAKRWEKKNWMGKPGKSRLNADLWKALLGLCDTHDVTMTWVRGHNGVAENERADELAESAARIADLLPDPEY